jgi:myo-inositol 2-dehydrogenase/D-chiro-inositol 1-dehydrogenase
MNIAVGVIGTGVMGAEHARLLRDEVRGGHLAAVCDVDAARAAEAAQGAAVFTDPAALIASPLVGAVVIASPDATHAALARACLDAGKPVLCEKPLAATAAEALGLVRAEAACGRRLITVGYMRRFDSAYAEMKRTIDGGTLGQAVLLHNTHRNASAPDWFTGPMAVTNSFVHEIDISRWLMGAEMVSAQVHAGPGGDPLVITMETGAGHIVSTEVTMNAVYGYHVHAEVLCKTGVVGMAAPTRVLTDHAQSHGHSWPLNWVPRFAEAYRLQMAAWLASLQTGRPVGASAWDGYAASAIAEQVVSALQSGQKVALTLADRPALYG